jgi:hypothetical protein
MFSASAHLDAFRGDWNNPVTTYHYTMALRLIREKLAAPNKAPDEGTIACIPTMVFFSVSLSFLLLVYEPRGTQSNGNVPMVVSKRRREIIPDPQEGTHATPASKRRPLRV